MKKFIICVLISLLVLSFVGCKESKEVYLPPHTVLEQTASLDGADSLTQAYIRATDTAINLVADKMLKDTPENKPEYISFDFATSFALRKDAREKLVNAFEVYGIALDTHGEAGHSGIAEQSKGFVIQYIVGTQHNKAEYDFTITVEVLYRNKGYAYYFDFNIFDDKYVMVNYEDAYEKMR